MCSDFSLNKKSYNNNDKLPSPPIRYLPHNATVVPIIVGVGKERRPKIGTL